MPGAAEAWISARCPGALLIGADYRALGAARSLGRRGIPVRVLVTPGEPLARTSRYAKAVGEWPEDDDRRAELLARLAIQPGLAGWALIPSADESAAFVARRHDELARHYVHTVPPWEVLRWTYDKRLTYELADRLGVPYPLTALRMTPDEAAEIDIPFPAIVKPAVKTHSNELTNAKAWRVDDREQLKRALTRASKLIEPDAVMIQELIPGNGAAQFSYAALYEDGKPLAEVTARRTRQYPADFGRASTFVETINCPKLMEPSRRLLAELAYTGLIEIEYKCDPRDGVLKLLDMNPRVWGWHTLCADAGVDFPWLLWLLVARQAVPPTTARAGIGWLRFSTDTPIVVKELLSGRLSLGEYQRSLRTPRARPIFAWDDPLPGLIELPLMFYVLARRVMKGMPV